MLILDRFFLKYEGGQIQQGNEKMTKTSNKPTLVKINFSMKVLVH